jgi:hypothetical protein
MPNRNAQDGFAVFFDSTDAGLPETQHTEFEVAGGSLRRGYRTGYVFDSGGPAPQVRVGNTQWTVNVAPFAAQRVQPVRAGTTEAQLAAMLAADTDLVWDAGVEVTLTKVLPIKFKNVRWVNARLKLVPANHASTVFVDVVAPGFRVENLAVKGVLNWQWDKGHKGTCDMFHVRAGGSLVCRPAGPGGAVTATTIDTFCHVSSNHAGVVVEGPILTDTREYVLYQDGGDAGVSIFRARVDAHGNEPFFRVIDHPPDAVRAANVYIGYCEAKRRANDPVGKDGITPRDCRRFAADTNVLHRCQIRSGQDDQGVIDGGSDPDDVLIVNNTVHASYLDHKRGRGQSRRVYVLGNKFHTPHVKPPIMFSGTTDSVVADNVWVGGDPQWRPQKANENAGLTLRNNGNGGPVIDPNAEIRAKIAAVDAKLAALASSIAGLQADQATLQAQRAELEDRLV